ncbi:hypothetical protein DVS77_14810 [Mycolicibacterium moriokaense]|nr:hypothetical protein DVS77_14810 [Mycolicibacterium moriokaense]
MKTGWTTRRVAASLGIAAFISMGVLTACGGGGEKAPETSTTTTTTTTESATPTEKAPRLDPNGPNPFSPSVVAPAAPTAVPGNKENSG